MEDVSQFGEYGFLENYFLKHSPKYNCLVDAGAHGMPRSNSYNFLRDYVWKGLLIEPNMRNFRNLEELYARYPNVLLENVAVSFREGEAEFYLHDVAGHHSLKHTTDESVMVSAFRLSTLMFRNRIPVDFDYLTIDVEGLDYDVVKDMLENSKYRPTIIVHEKDLGKKFKGNLLESFKYEVIYETRGNFIYRKKG